MLGFRNERQGQVQERCGTNYSVPCDSYHGKGEEGVNPTLSRGSGSLRGGGDASVQSYRTVRGCPDREPEVVQAEQRMRGVKGSRSGKWKAISKGTARF